MLDVGGQDATEAFEDVGHSDEAREILDGMLVGTLKREASHHLPIPINSPNILPPFLSYSPQWPLFPSQPPHSLSLTQFTPAPSSSSSSTPSYNLSVFANPLANISSKK